MDSGNYRPRPVRKTFNRPPRRRPSDLDIPFFQALKKILDQAPRPPAGSDNTKPGGMENRKMEIREGSASIILNLEAAADKQGEDKMRMDFFTAGNNVGVKNPEDEYILLKHKGLVGYKEDGTPFYFKLDEGGQKVPVSSPRDLMRWIYTTNPAKRNLPETAAEARRAFHNK